jgi:hypothetical protein
MNPPMNSLTSKTLESIYYTRLWDKWLKSSFYGGHFEFGALTGFASFFAMDMGAKFFI